MIDSLDHIECSLGTSAGGCRNNLSRFATNPQYLLTVLGDDGEVPSEDPSSGSDDDDPNHNREAKTLVIISLAQEHRRTRRDRKVKLLQVLRT